MTLKLSDSLENALEIYVQSEWTPSNFQEMLTDSQEKLINSQKKLKANLKSTLRKLVLPQWGFTQEQLKNEFDKCCGQILAKDFQLLAPLYFNEAYELLKEKSRFLKQKSPKGAESQDGTLRNYKSDFNRFMKWLSQQDWDFGSQDEKVVQWTNEIINIPERTPKLQAKIHLAKHGRKKKQNNNNEKSYSLKPEELASHPLLPKQFEALQDYWTLDYVPERRGEQKL
jgi:hypothetical protein